MLQCLQNREKHERYGKMDEFVKTLLIVCPLVFLGGFVDSVAGGGGLITLPAYLMAGLGAHFAMGTNKVVNACGTMIASVRYFKGGKVELPPALISGAGALVGSFLGSKLALLIPEETLKMLMLVALPVIAVVLMFKKDFGNEPGQKAHYGTQRMVIASALIGFVIGGYDGLVGPGTGTFMIMAFTAALSMDLLTASGCSKVANLASNISSAVLFACSGKVMWMLAVPAAICNVLGALAGTRYAMRGGSKKVRGMIFVVLGLLFIKVITELFF